ncbi:MAG TPA: hypothetical protein VKR32_12435 [Puia sp.]|nr:hypothetical protein [Puia sp.]
MAFKSPLRLIKRILGNLYFLTFLNGLFLASLFYVKMEANYENQLFQVIQHSINKTIDINDTQDSIVVKAMHVCNNLLSIRSTVFENDESLDGFKVAYFHPATIDLMTAKGACGSYSMILARVLQGYSYPVRISQMKANGVYAAHNIVEVQLANKWIVLDPTYNLYFTTPGSQLAGFDEIRDNWNFYRKQVPPNYNPNYRYEDVRYTNWGKVPVLSTVMKASFGLILGKKRLSTFCLRTHFLKTYDVYFYFLMSLYIPVLILTLMRVIRTKVFPTHDTPLTARNVAKHIRRHLADPTLNRGIDS